MPQGLHAGAAVRLVGLLGASELNGTTGTCLQLDSSAERWIVRLAGGTQKSIKPSNLEIYSQLSAGALVRARALIQAYHLNGRTGTCIRRQYEGDRWLVRFANGEEKAIRPENLEYMVQPGLSNADVRNGAARRARSRSRSPQTATRNTLAFGRHAGRSYEEVFEHEPQYCQWALTRIGDRTTGADMGNGASRGDFQNFTSWLRHQLMQGATPGDSLAEIRSRSVGSNASYLAQRSAADSGSHSAGNTITRVVDPRDLKLQRDLDRLPRVPFCSKLFSGDPYPTACAICLEAWVDDVASAIVMTPCLHVFHESCLKVWIFQRPECPSCRWDITDVGEAKTVELSKQISSSRAFSSKEVVFVADDAEEVS